MFADKTGADKVVSDTIPAVRIDASISTSSLGGRDVTGANAFVRHPTGIAANVLNSRAVAIFRAVQANRSSIAALPKTQSLDPTTER